MLSFLVVTKQREVVDTIRKALDSVGPVETMADRGRALAAVRKKRRDIVFIDMTAVADDPDGTFGEKAVTPFKELYPNIEIVLITKSAELDKAAAVKAGAEYYLTHPVSQEEVRALAESIADRRIRRSELEYLRDRTWRDETEDMVHTRCDNVRDAFEKAKAVAPTRTTVLLTGETGSGKGVLAKFIHSYSKREKAQFISVHCGAIPDTLLESELFGHEKGAFTGAVRRKPGKFEIAKGGTIFLDEIGTVTSSAQIKLLQVLQDGTFSRVGGDDLLRSDARVVAATNADLKQLAEQGLFRKDLYYRLNVFPIEAPPLRERLDDIPLFVDAFLGKLEMAYHKGIVGADAKVIGALRNYSWPGNIRELENLIERAYIIEKTSTLTPKSFPIELFSSDNSPAILSVDDSLPLAEARKIAVEEFEKQYLKKLLARNAGKINTSADKAGITTRQLHKLLCKYEIHKEAFKG